MDNNKLTESKLSDEQLTEVSGGYVGPCILYTVVKGDTLERLAKRYGTTVDVLVGLNHIKDPSRIRIGQRLLIPSPQM